MDTNNNQIKYTCLSCSKQFKTQNTLNQHLKTTCKIQEKNKNFQCEYCGKSLSSNQMLKYHTEICLQSKLKQKDNDFINEIRNLEHAYSYKLNMVYEKMREQLSIHQMTIVELKSELECLKSILSPSVNNKTMSDIKKIPDDLYFDKLRINKDEEKVINISNKLKNMSL